MRRLVRLWCACSRAKEASCRLKKKCGTGSERGVRWRTDMPSGSCYNQSMETSAPTKKPTDIDDATVASAIWVLAATAWFVMAILFVRNGLFSAVLLLIIALICLPGMRAAFRQRTGVRIPGLATASAIVALAVGSFASAGRNIEVSAGGQASDESTLGANAAEPTVIGGQLPSSSVAATGSEL